MEYQWLDENRQAATSFTSVGAPAGAASRTCTRKTMLWSAGIAIVGAAAVTALLMVLLHKSEAVDRGQFLIVSDIHLDPFYNVDRGAACYCHDRPGTTCPSTRNPFGQFGCDSPQSLVTAAIQAMRGALRNPDFIVSTGDFVRHDASSLHDAGNATLAMLRNVTQQLDDAYPGVPRALLALSLGNNDMERNYYLDPNQQPNRYLQRIHEFWNAHQPSDEETASFRRGGYYATAVTNKIVVVALNTVLYSVKHHPDSTADPDPAGQFQWLEGVLGDAKRGGLTVYITAHIPPSISLFDNAALWHAQYVDRYIGIVARYASTVGAQLFGHEHVFGFTSMHRDIDNGTSVLPPPLLLTAAVSPVYLNNPAFCVVEYDRKTGKLLDSVAWAASLAAADVTPLPHAQAHAAAAAAAAYARDPDASQERRSLLATSLPDMPALPVRERDSTLRQEGDRVVVTTLHGSALQWKPLYRTSVAYGTAAIDGPSFAQLADRFVTDEAELLRYTGHTRARFGDGQACDPTCRRRAICGALHMRFDAYLRCLNSMMPQSV